MNEGGEGAAPMADGHPLGAPSSYKRHPSPLSHSHLLVKDLSPPLELFPMVSN